jgi:hypothetical protein
MNTLSDFYFLNLIALFSCFSANDKNTPTYLRSYYFPNLFYLTSIHDQNGLNGNLFGALWNHLAELQAAGISLMG